MKKNNSKKQSKNKSCRGYCHHSNHNANRNREQHFWLMVYFSLVSIYHLSAQDAEERTKAKQRVSSVLPNQKEFYKQHPLDIAHKIALKNVITPDERIKNLEQYETIEKAINRD